eukprot:COSAG01_NODE_5129_length_4468_cov_4.222477_6_plen_121_part_01
MTTVDSWLTSAFASLCARRKEPSRRTERAVVCDLRRPAPCMCRHSRGRPKCMPAWVSLCSAMSAWYCASADDASPTPPPHPDPPYLAPETTKPTPLPFFNDTATTEIYTALNTLSLHDALP